MKAVISYILKFLIGGDKAAGLSGLVGYTSDPRLFSKYRVVIIPSPFFQENVFGTSASMPELPLPEVEGVPLLFGTPQAEYYRGTLIIHADIVASAYFLLTRYEEIRRRDKRDIHGRFPGKSSLPYRAGFIHRPVVDEYGKLLRNWLRQTQTNVPEPKPIIRKIWLTHDVDAPFYCRSLRSFARETLKGSGLLKAWKYYYGPLSADPYYTFPWLIKQNNSLIDVLGKEHCKSLFFFKPAGNSPQDRPFYKLSNKDTQELFSLCKTEQIGIGLHSSYDAGKTPSLIASEREALERVTKKTIRYNRHHFLSSREPEDMDWLEKIGITDDFTMGYADVAGFRLGTSRPVRWINPGSKRISSLVLHPLTMMDCTLSEPSYMSLTEEEAFACASQLIEQVKLMNGELILLWHNDTVADEGKQAVSVDWQKALYTKIIEELKQSVQK